MTISTNQRSRYCTWCPRRTWAACRCSGRENCLDHSEWTPSTADQRDSCSCRSPHQRSHNWWGYHLSGDTSHCLWSKLAVMDTEHEPMLTIVDTGVKSCSATTDHQCYETFLSQHYSLITNTNILFQHVDNIKILQLSLHSSCQRRKFLKLIKIKRELSYITEFTSAANNFWSSVDLQISDLSVENIFIPEIFHSWLKKLLKTNLWIV